MPDPDYDGAIAYAIARLRQELPAHLTYHNLWHTQAGVIPAARRLARLSQISPDDVRLLEVAAAFHDVGTIHRLQGHEIISARITAQQLPQFGFSNTQIEAIMGMIMATRLPQSPRTLLEEILADADLDVLGRPDYFERNQALRQERAAMGSVQSERDWFKDQLVFYRHH